MMGLMHRTADQAKPAIGRVIGEDAGKLLVQVDDEEGPRTIGIERVRGQRFKYGDKIPLIQPRGAGEGQYLAGGAISGRQGLDPAVDNADLYGDSVDRRALHTSVTNDIDQARAKADQGIDEARQARDRADEARNRADAAQNDANTARDRADEARNRADAAQNDANNARDRADAAKDRADAAYSLAQSAVTESQVKNWINDEIDQHVSRKH
jgi:hypothetical protein